MAPPGEDSRTQGESEALIRNLKGADDEVDEEDDDDDDDENDAEIKDVNVLWNLIVEDEALMFELGEFIQREGPDVMNKKKGRKKIKEMAAKQQEKTMSKKQEKQNRVVPFVKAYIVKEVQGGSCLMKAANDCIKEDWLGGVSAIPGNVYRIAAFSGLRKNLHISDVQSCARTSAGVLIFLVQLLAPPGVFFTCTHGLRMSESQKYKWTEWCLLDNSDGCASSLSDWTGQDGWWLGKLMSIFFICLFSLNGVFIIYREREAWRRIDEMLWHIEGMDRKAESLLYVDCIMNCWVTLWCAVDTYLLVGGANSMKEVIFDSLSLIFLLTLDDVGSVGMFDEQDWDAKKLGWIYEHLVKVNSDEENEDEGCCNLRMWLYDLTASLLMIFVVLLPVAAIFTPFARIAHD